MLRNGYLTQAETSVPTVVLATKITGRHIVQRGVCDSSDTKGATDSTVVFYCNIFQYLSILSYSVMCTLQQEQMILEQTSQTILGNTLL
jgi:hypothetical protein